MRCSSRWVAIPQILLVRQTDPREEQGQCSTVAGTLNGTCLEQLSYAVGALKPLYILVETHGTEQGSLTADDTTIVSKMEFDF